VVFLRQLVRLQIKSSPLLLTEYLRPGA